VKINQLRNIHSWIRSTEISEILFVSALVFPAYILLYNFAVNEINPSWKLCTLIIATLAYISGIIWMKVSQSSDEKDIRDISIIKNYIIDKGFEFMSFEKLKEIDKSFTQERIKELLFVFPNDIRLAKLKGDKKGIKVLNIEKQNI
jgi:hypothetical protein